MNEKNTGKFQTPTRAVIIHIHKQTDFCNKETILGTNSRSATNEVTATEKFKLKSPNSMLKCKI